MRAELKTIHAADIRDEHGSGLDQAEANFGRNRTGSDCNFLKIVGSGLDRTEKICCFDVIILTTSNMLVVM